MTDERPNDYDIFHEVPPPPAGTREWMEWYGLTDADIPQMLEDPTAPPLPGSPVARRAEYLAKIRKAAAASAPPKAKPEVAAPAAEPAKDAGPNQPKPVKLTVDEQALAVFFKDPTLTKADIAHRLGKDPPSLAPDRCPKLDAVMKGYKAKIDPNRRQTRGQKDADGNLEAWKDES